MKESSGIVWSLISALISAEICVPVTLPFIELQFAMLNQPLGCASQKHGLQSIVPGLGSCSTPQSGASFFLRLFVMETEYTMSDAEELFAEAIFAHLLPHSCMALCTLISEKTAPREHQEIKQVFSQSRCSVKAGVRSKPDPCLVSQSARAAGMGRRRRCAAGFRQASEALSLTYTNMPFVQTWFWTEVRRCRGVQRRAEVLRG